MTSAAVEAYDGANGAGEDGAIGVGAEGAAEVGATEGPGAGVGIGVAGCGDGAKWHLAEAFARQVMGCL